MDSDSPEASRTPDPAASVRRLHSREIATPTRHRTGDAWDSHAHPEHELLSSITGTVTVVTPHTIHVLPPGSAIWLPADEAHAVHAAPGNTMRCTWFDVDAVPDALTRTTVLTTSPLLDDVLTHLDGCADPARRLRAEAFALDLLSTSALPHDGLPQPRTPWLVAVTQALSRHPGDSRTVDEWAARCAVSTRTFTRRFQSETGLTFSAWRSRLRLQAAMARLADGQSVAQVGKAVGFDSPSAFTAAFRRDTGVSPRGFARGRRTA